MKIDKKRLYPIVLLLLMFVVYKYREHQNNQLQYIEGETMGTTYHIKYLGKQNLKFEIDSILKLVNISLSTYMPESEISIFNRNGYLDIKSSFFYPVISKSADIYTHTTGAFDPTVMPIVNAWGFGFKNKERVDSALIDSLLNFIGFDKIQFDKEIVSTSNKGVMLDFSAIAKGYGVDVIASFFRSLKIYNYMIEIGGEVICLGSNEDANVWKIGIDNPIYQEKGGDRLSQIVELKNSALATSGNYRNYYLDSSGIRRAHTINPKTGYPVQHSLLSASVKSKDCMTSDGYATALMVLGVDEAKKLADEINEIEVFLIYDNNGKLETWNTTNFFDNEKN